MITLKAVVPVPTADDVVAAQRLHGVVATACTDDVAHAGTAELVPLPGPDDGARRELPAGFRC